MSLHYLVKYWYSNFDINTVCTPRSIDNFVNSPWIFIFFCLQTFRKMCDKTIVKDPTQGGICDTNQWRGYRLRVVWETEASSGVKGQSPGRESGGQSLRICEKGVSWRARRARAYNGGLVRWRVFWRAPAGSRGRTIGQGVKGGFARLKLKAF